MAGKGATAPLATPLYPPLCAHMCVFMCMCVSTSHAIITTHVILSQVDNTAFLFN